MAQAVDIATPDAAPEPHQRLSRLPPPCRFRIAKRKRPSSAAGDSYPRRGPTRLLGLPSRPWRAPRPGPSACGAGTRHKPAWVDVGRDRPLAGPPRNSSHSARSLRPLRTRSRGLADWDSAGAASDVGRSCGLAPGNARSCRTPLASRGACEGFVSITSEYVVSPGCEDFSTARA
jgi:hypothetical protein